MESPANPERFIHWYRLSAKQGFAAAQYNLGVMYDRGSGVPEDDAEAVRWYRRAAEQENAIAQFTLGMMYSRGDRVPEDEAEAVRWYRLAAEQGDALAQANLGVMYAKRWYLLETEKVGALAQTNLGVMYANVDAVPQDLVLAFMWLTLSAAQGNETAQSNKDVIERWLTREEIAEAQRLSREWIERHAQEGSEPSETIRIPNRPR